MTTTETFIQLVDYSMALICRACNTKVLDPDKKHPQVYLNGKCPSCHQMSSPPEPKKSKKQLKRERKAQVKAMRKAQARGLSYYQFMNLL